MAEGLAQRIVSNDVPEALQGRILMALDMGALIAGEQDILARFFLRLWPTWAQCAQACAFLLGEWMDGWMDGWMVGRAWVFAACNIYA